MNHIKNFQSYLIKESTQLKDSYHRKGVINKKNGHLGVIHNWGWKGSYLFLDIEDGSSTELSDLNDIEIIDNKDFNELYKERNYRQPKDGEEFNKRQIDHGRINDSTLKAMEKGASSGEYTDDFAREVAMIFSISEFYKELLNTYGTVNIAEIQKTDPSGVKELFQQFQFGEESSYSKMCDKMGLHGETPISENEIIDKLESAKEFAEEQGIDWPALEGEYSEELKFFLKLIK